MLNFLIQDGAEVAQDLEPIVEEKTLSIMDLLMTGGIAGQIIIAILFVLLFVAVYIYFERLFAIKAASKMDSNFMNQIHDHVSKGNIEGAKLLCSQNYDPVSQLTAKGLLRLGMPLEDINSAIENGGRIERYKLEK